MTTARTIGGLWRAKRRADIEVARRSASVAITERRPIDAIRACDDDADSIFAAMKSEAAWLARAEAEAEFLGFHLAAALIPYPRGVRAPANEEVSRADVELRPHRGDDGAESFAWGVPADWDLPNADRIGLIGLPAREMEAGL